MDWILAGASVLCCCCTAGLYIEHSDCLQPADAVVLLGGCWFALRAAFVVALYGCLLGRLVAAYWTELPPGSPCRT